ncbi:MAG: aspartate aminotransferase family protein [Saccharothrix sp.]|nr:aspartate aminotransferase family protein [Saccharothrix sp.]
MTEHLDEFRRHGYAVVDRIARYWAELEDLPVTPDVEPGAVTALLPERAPEHAEPVDAVLADVDRLLLPGMAHWQHPGFLAHFPMTTSAPAVLGELLTAGLNPQAMLWSANPALVELETVVCDWLVDLLGLPDPFRGNGVLGDTASGGVLVALAAALWRRGGSRWRERGVDPRYTAYTSTEGNCSIAKAVRIAGLGEAALRFVDTDPHTHAMRPDHLRALVEADLADGRVPVMVAATVGTTSTTAVDPIADIGRVCREHGVWLHVDAAYAGVAAVCPELRWIHDGVDLADSYCVNPHKWLLSGFECSALWVADRAALTAAMTTAPPYLRATTDHPAAVDFRDRQLQLGHRSRALRLWFVLRCHGVEGLRAHIRHGTTLARRFADHLRTDDRFEITAPHPFSLVCFRLRADDATNTELLRRLNATGRVLLSDTVVHGRHTLRLATGGPTTHTGHIDRAWHLVSTTATALLDDRRAASPDAMAVTRASIQVPH